MGVQIVTKRRGGSDKEETLGKPALEKKLNMKLHIIAFALVVVSLSADAKDLGHYSWSNGRNFRKISDDLDLVNDTDDKDGKEGDNGLDATIPAISPQMTSAIVFFRTFLSPRLGLHGLLQVHAVQGRAFKLAEFARLGWACACDRCCS